jgi:hypothetical protein
LATSAHWFTSGHRRMLGASDPLPMLVGNPFDIDGAEVAPPA